MGKIRLTLKTSFGEVSVEGQSVSDLRDSLSEIGIPESNIANILETIRQKLEAPVPVKTIAVVPSKPEFTGVIEFTSDGTPHLIVPPDNLTGREVIGLLLYAKSPNTISMRELTSLVSDNWKSVKIQKISAYLSHMRAFIIKEGTRGSYSYRLSGSGRNWVEKELLPRLKSLTRT